MKPSLLILAAGIGSRYGGLKQLDAIGPHGETIIDYSIYDALFSGFGNIVFIIKESIDKEFRETVINKLKPYANVGVVHQEIWKVPEGIDIPKERIKPWGTGHAALMAAGKIDGPFAVINSDDFYGRAAYRSVSDYYREWTGERENDYCMAGYQVGNTLSEFGAVSRGVCETDAGSFLREVIERTHIERIAGHILYRDEHNNGIRIPDETFVSMNFWGFTPSFFGYLKEGFGEFIRAHSNNPKAEYYIPFAVNQLIGAGKATVKLIPCHERWFGMTYREDRKIVTDSINSLVSAGIYPEKLWD
jgi:hypothetical protein